MQSHAEKFANFAIRREIITDDFSMMNKIWEKELIDISNPEKAKILSSFFKTGPGEYGEGDRFVGITVPANRAISRLHAFDPLEDIKEMLDSPIHEFRLAGLLALVERYKKSKKNPDEQKRIVDFYLDNMHKCDNWDLVDLSAPYILGEHLMKHPDEELLTRLSLSPTLWIQRIAIVATHPMIRSGKFDTTLRLAEQYIAHKHDLIHKATGWMLREVGKHGGMTTLTAFLDKHAPSMPRTMLRYSIEKMQPQQRTKYMKLQHPQNK